MLYDKQTNGLRSAKKVALDRGVSPTTLWRWGQAGYLRFVNISGRPYVDLASLDEFDKRAASGEFARPPGGAAARSSRARKAGALAAAAAENSVAGGEEAA
ncbi:MAG: hypothetical protein EXS36_12875 [Pedosphaera sp.]|nr:hypothetical protein [Pedosphaera sp.]